MALEEDYSLGWYLSFANSAYGVESAAYQMKLDSPYRKEVVDEDFSTMTNYYLGGSQLQNAAQSWSHLYTSATDTHRFEVRAGDVWVNDQSYAERSEITNLAPEAFRKLVRVKYRFMVEPGAPNTSDRIVIGQFHETPDGSDAAVRPCFAMELKNERMRAYVRYTAAAVTVDPPPEVLLFLDTVDITRGRWYNIQIDIKFDPAGNGYAVIYRDGKQVANYSGPVGSNDALGPYWKMGIYRASTVETIAMQYKNLTIQRRT